MSRRAQVHIFWGAPVGPLKTTVSQEATPLLPTADPWKKIQLVYSQRSLHVKDKNQEFENVKEHEVLEATGPSDLLSGQWLATCVNRSLQMKDDFMQSASEAHNVKSQVIHSSRLSNTINSNVQICDLKDRVQHLCEEGMYQKLQCENKKITDERFKSQSNTCQNFETDFSQLDHKCTSVLDLDWSNKPINMESEAVGTKYMSTEHHEIQSQDFFSFDTKCEPGVSGVVRKVSDLKISTDTEFLSIMTSSQLAFLAQGKDKDGQDCTDKGTINTEVEPSRSHGKVRITEDNFVRLSGEFGEKCESGQSQAHSLELFSPICPESQNSQIHINPGKDFEENIDSQELFSNEDKLLPNEVHIESCSSGILCSQLNNYQNALKRSWTSEDKSGHSEALSKKLKMNSNTTESAKVMSKRIVSEFKDIKKITLIKNCDSKSQKYNCLVMVLTPCHMKEINIKSGPNSGSKVPLATITVIDQSEIKKRVVLWRTAAFWTLTVFLGDIILLTDVNVHEDQWIGETVLQSSFTSQLLNLGSYSCVHPEEYSSIVGSVVLQDLLAYVSSKHSYLKDLPPRQPQKVNSVEFVELEQLQPDILVHAVVRVVDVIVLTEALYSYRGQKQRKVIVTVEQVQGQHYVLVLWGPGAAWYPQLQRKRDCIWEFKYLLVQRDCTLENLELHTTLWSSCECLFDDDMRAVTFKTKFQKSIPSFVKTSDLAAHLKDKYSGVVLIKAKISQLAFSIGTMQKIVLNAQSSLSSIFTSLPNVVYAGCALCGLELQTDENRIYKQCWSCLPFSRKKVYYRPALMTIVDGRHDVCVHVGSKLMEQILLNISPDCLSKTIVPSSEVTYGLVAADLIHSLLAVSAEPRMLKIQSRFELDENSYPMHQEFSLLDFCFDPHEAGAQTHL